jgi:hypothetical protein
MHGVSPFSKLGWADSTACACPTSKKNHDAAETVVLWGRARRKACESKCERGDRALAGHATYGANWPVGDHFTHGARGSQLSKADVFGQNMTSAVEKSL